MYSNIYFFKERLGINIFPGFTLVETNYYKIRGKQTYFEARDLCLSEGGRLAVGYTGQMLAEIQKFMQASS